MAKQENKKKAKKHISTLYEKESKKNKFCPKCGEGFFMAKHKDRETCGQCGYTEFGTKEKKE